MKYLSIIQTLVALPSLLLVSCVNPEQRIAAADFASQPAVIRSLFDEGKISKEAATLHYQQWRHVADERNRKARAFQQWYAKLTPQQQAAYEQSRMQAVSALMQSHAMMSSMQTQSYNSMLDRQTYEETECAFSPCCQST